MAQITITIPDDAVADAILDLEAIAGNVLAVQGKGGALKGVFLFPVPARTDGHNSLTFARQTVVALVRGILAYGRRYRARVEYEAELAQIEAPDDTLPDNIVS
jgi:hypothetical protein